MKKMNFNLAKTKSLRLWSPGNTLKYLDELIDGVNEGELITIAARSGQGKSTLARNIIKNCNWLDRKVLLVSTEETEYEITRKLNKLWDNFDENLLFLEDKEFSIEQIEKDIKESKAKIVVIDYVQQLEGNIRENTKQLKRLAVKYKCIIFILSQLNRGAQNKIPDVSMLSKSDNILHDSDQVWLITTTELINDNGSTLVLLDVAKNRKGRIGKIWLALHKEEGKFVDVSPEWFKDTNEALANNLAKRHPQWVDLILDQLGNIYIPKQEKPFMVLKSGIIL